MKMWKSKKKSSFSLLEVLICLVLLVGMGGFFSVRGYHLLGEKRAHVAMRRLSDELYLTKTLALTHQIDITITLKQGPSYIVLERKTDFAPGAVSKYFQKSIKLSNLVLKGNNREIHFYSNGWIDDTKPIFFHTKSKNSPLRSIDFDNPRKLMTHLD